LSLESLDASANSVPIRQVHAPCPAAAWGTLQPGGIWHPYRRLFAIELKALPIHDVAAAGGWSSVETVQRIYQKAEAEGVLKAVQSIGKRGA
jgi:hypothetical protein